MEKEMQKSNLEFIKGNIDLISMVSFVVFIVVYFFVDNWPYYYEICQC